MAYCEWLSAKFDQGEESRIFTLPTEAQWEKAARGTHGRIFPWGNSPDPCKANYVDTGIDWASPVGSFPAGKSPYGIQDLAGNIWEWCLDGKKKKKKVKTVDPLGESQTRVVRGGAWFNSSQGCRAAFRDWNVPGFRSPNLGFRLVRLQGQLVDQGAGKS